MAEFSVGMEINSYALLEELPVGSAVVDEDGWVYQSDYFGPAIAGVKREIEWSFRVTWWKTKQIQLPVKLIHLSNWADQSVDLDEKEES